MLYLQNVIEKVQKKSIPNMRAVDKGHNLAAFDLVIVIS
jgi:hypothetical protein